MGKGTRMGLRLLLKNSQTRIDKKKKQMVYPSKLLDELDEKKVEKKQKKRNWSRTASIKERKNKQNKSLKKVMVKLKKRLAAGERYVRYKDKFYRVDLAKLAEANSLLENAKKNRKALT